MCLLQVYERVLYSVGLFLLDNRGAAKRRNSILFPLDWVCMCWLSVTGDLKSLYLFNSRRLLELPFMDCPLYDFASLAPHLLWWSSGVWLGGVEEHGSF